MANKSISIVPTTGRQWILHTVENNLIAIGSTGDTKQIAHENGLANVSPHVLQAFPDRSKKPF